MWRAFEDIVGEFAIGLLFSVPKGIAVPLMWAILMEQKMQSSDWQARFLFGAG